MNTILDVKKQPKSTKATPPIKKYKNNLTSNNISNFFKGLDECYQLGIKRNKQVNYRFGDEHIITLNEETNEITCPTCSVSRLTAETIRFMRSVGIRKLIFDGATLEKI